MRSGEHLLCPYRIGAIRDRREDADAGGTRYQAFAVDEVIGAVREQLMMAGFDATEGAATSASPDVAIDVRQLYFQRNTNTNVVGVAVLQVSVGSGPTFVVRSQPVAGIDSDGTSVGFVLGGALQGATSQLVARLNATCRVSAAKTPDTFVADDTILADARSRSAVYCAKYEDGCEVTVRRSDDGGWTASVVPVFQDAGRWRQGRLVDGAWSIA